MEKNKKIILDFIESRKGWTGALSIDRLYINITYYLIKTGRAGMVENADDVCLIYDNLIVNNEILQAHNIADFDAAEIEKKYNIKNLIKNIKSGFIYILNYDRLKKLKNGHEVLDRIDACIKLKADFNAFEGVI